MRSRILTAPKKTAGMMRYEHKLSQPVYPCPRHKSWTMNYESSCLIFLVETKPKRKPKRKAKSSQKVDTSSDSNLELDSSSSSESSSESSSSSEKGVRRGEKFSLLHLKSLVL